MPEFFNEPGDENSGDTILNHKSLICSDTSGTSKALLGLADGAGIETVLIKHSAHYTACLSSQVGCALGCVFCATGQDGFVRDLEAAEIISQIDFWNDYLSKENKKIKNVVFMGMGEPFLNWDNVKQALHSINSPNGLNIGQRRITVSTCGIVDKMKAFAKEFQQINLAVSLHSAVDETRSRLMPINKKYPLKTLLRACLCYVEQTRRKLFFEYTLFRGINDTDQEIRQLMALINKHYLFHLNLIPYHLTNCGLIPTKTRRRNEIISLFNKNKLSYTIRKSFGTDIFAACGQLRLNAQQTMPGVITT